MTERLARDATAETAPSANGIVDQLVFHAGNGCEVLRQRLVRLTGGSAYGAEPSDEDEVLFVVGGRGRLLLDGDDQAHALERETGAYVAPGERFSVEQLGDEPLLLVSVAVAASGDEAAAGTRRVTVRLGDQDDQQATANREFRLVVDPGSGCASATQFVGVIPPGRAPDHYHHYDEVLYVLEGEGVLHIGDAHDPIGAGSCIHLSARLVHSLENVGAEPMRVLGVFRPAGPPSEAYYPDGTRATY